MVSAASSVDVGETGRVGRADGVRAVEHEFEVEAGVAEQDGRGGCGIAAVADESGLGPERGDARARALAGGGDEAAVLHAVAGGVGVAHRGERGGFVEEGLGASDHLCAALRVVRAGG